jgi:hypothetical protein
MPLPVSLDTKGIKVSVLKVLDDENQSLPKRNAHAG